jgi:hypothetical protein
MKYTTYPALVLDMILSRFGFTLMLFFVQSAFVCDLGRLWLLS